MYVRVPMNKDSKYENYVSNCVNVFIVFQSYSLPKDFMQTSVIVAVLTRIRRIMRHLPKQPCGDINYRAEGWRRWMWFLFDIHDIGTQCNHNVPFIPSLRKCHEMTVINHDCVIFLLFKPSKVFSAIRSSILRYLIPPPWFAVLSLYWLRYLIICGFYLVSIH